uniref:F-box domain-containing protein n=1 Tax=Syphacia muris TaxID=451379 RepID=A0A0N5ASG1_9BILA
MVRTGESPKLNELPREIIIMILNYIPSEELWQNIRKTCRLFHDLLLHSYFWFNRTQCLGFEPRLCGIGDDSLHIIRCCIDLEKQRKLWTKERLGQYLSALGHTATVDALQFFSSSDGSRFCVSGSRDRSLVLWDIENMVVNEKVVWKVATYDLAHQGWIWSVSVSDSEIFCSCGWDRCVKRWQIAKGSMEVTNSTVCSGTVLRVLCDKDTVFYSTFDRKVGLMDARLGLNIVAEAKFHKDSVLDLAHLQNSPYLYSCGEDSRILCIDQRTWKVVKSLKLPASPRTLSLDAQSLLCGTADGKMITLDVENFTCVGEVIASPLCQVLQVQLTPACQICITRERGFCMYTAGKKPTLLAESNDFETELARVNRFFDLHNDDLAITCGDGQIMFWVH